VTHTTNLTENADSDLRQRDLFPSLFLICQPSNNNNGAIQYDNVTVQPMWYIHVHINIHNIMYTHYAIDGHGLNGRSLNDRRRWMTTSQTVYLGLHQCGPNNFMNIYSLPFIDSVHMPLNSCCIAKCLSARFLRKVFFSKRVILYLSDVVWYCTEIRVYFTYTLSLQ